MQRVAAARLFREYQGTISLEQALSLTRWKATRSRELAGLLMAEGFWPIPSEGQGSFVYRRRANSCKIS